MSWFALAHSFAHKHRFHRSRSPLRSLFNLCFWTIYCTNSYQLILNTYLDGAKLRKTFCNAWHLLGLSQLLLSTLFNEMCGNSLLKSVLPQIVPLYHMLCNIKARNLHCFFKANTLQHRQSKQLKYNNYTQRWEKKLPH